MLFVKIGGEVGRRGAFWEVVDYSVHNHELFATSSPRAGFMAIEPVISTGER
jgi:hypothetical protein